MSSRDGLADNDHARWLRWTKHVALGRLAMGVIMLASLAALVYGLVINWHELTSYDWRIVYWPILLGLALYPFALGFAVLTWRGILHHLGGNSRWQQDLRIYCVSNIARRLPTPVWYIAGRIYLYSEIEVPKSITSLAVLIEGVLILFSGLLLSLIILPFSTELGLINKLGVKLAPFVVIILVLILRPQFLRRFVGWLARRLGRGHTIGADVDYQHMLLWSTIYSLVWIIGGVTLFLLVRIVYPLPIGHMPTVIGIWAVGGVVSHLAVITPGGLGIKEVTLAALLSSLTPTPIAIIVSVSARLWYSLNELLWFALTARFSREKTKTGDINGKK